MNIKKAIQEGIEGRNDGLSQGLVKLDIALNGFQKGTSIALGAEPKVGKSALANFLWILQLYLKNPNKKIKWIYYSFEMSRIETEARFIAFLLWERHRIDISYNKVLGREKDEEGNKKILSEHELQCIDSIIKNDIYTLFGIYDDNGVKTQEGLIDFIEERTNPTGIRNDLMLYAKNNGEFIYETYDGEDKGKKVVKKRIVGYKENDPELTTIIFIDHIRAMAKERGYKMKENVDKMSEYHVWLRNICRFNFIFICHLNRGISDLDRLKYHKETLYPTGDDFKDLLQSSILGQLFINKFVINYN